MSSPHGPSGYNHGCRCDACRTAHSERQRRNLAARYARRQLVDGVLVAVEARSHGSSYVYEQWGCRCRPCVDARAVARRRWHRARQERRKAGDAG